MYTCMFTYIYIYIYVYAAKRRWQIDDAAVAELALDVALVPEELAPMFRREYTSNVIQLIESLSNMMYKVIIE